VSDLDVDIGLLKGLQFREFAPNHFALGGLLVLAKPSFELVVLRHCAGGVIGVVLCDEVRC